MARPDLLRQSSTARPRDRYRGTSIIRKRPPLGPYCRPMPRVLGGSEGGGRFLMSEVPLYMTVDSEPGGQ